MARRHAWLPHDPFADPDRRPEVRRSRAVVPGIGIAASAPDKYPTVPLAATWAFLTVLD